MQNLCCARFSAQGILQEGIEFIQQFIVIDYVKNLLLFIDSTVDQIFQCDAMRFFERTPVALSMVGKQYNFIWPRGKIGSVFKSIYETVDFPQGLKRLRGFDTGIVADVVVTCQCCIDGR